MPHISLVGEKIGNLGFLPVSNSLFTTWVVSVLIVVFALFVGSKLTFVPGKLQNLTEIILEFLYTLCQNIAPTKAKNFFPLVATFFIFILTANWFGLLPGVGTIGFFRKENHGGEFIPLLRPATADLNTTIALAIAALISVQYFGIKSSGFSYLKKFFDFRNPVSFYVGILEFISEVARLISFAFRLFGNIFAGEVLLVVIAFLMPLFVPIPFLVLEIFVGFIQALVFSVLTLVFLTLATVKERH